MRTTDDAALFSRWASRLAVPSLIAVVGLAQGVVGPTARPAARAAAHTVNDSAAPLPRVDAAAVRYRFEVPPTAGFEAAGELAALEVRVTAGGATAPDLAELAELHAARALQAGDPADLARAEELARASLAAQPEPSAAPLTLARVASARHQFREAIALAEGYLVRKPSPAAHLLVATASLALGELPRAVQAADAALEARPSSAAYLMRALVLEAQGRDAEATHDFGRAIAIEEYGGPREAARVRALWARFLLRRGAWEDARVLLAEALRIEPGAPLALALRGELALRTGRIADARAGFEEAFRADRETRYLIDQARAQELGGDAAGADQARAQIERLIRTELAARGTGHRLELVELLVDRGSPAAVAEAITLARAELGGRAGGETRFQLARALARAGQVPEALREARAALATGVRDARLYELMAQLERARGSAPRAALYAAEAARLDPPPPHPTAAHAWRRLGITVGGVP